MSETLLEVGQLRELEEKCARVLGQNTLMERAGSSAADYIASTIWPNEKKGTVTVLCGPGNNGGDGYVCARHLAQKGFTVVCVRVGGVNPKSAEAIEAKAQWEASGGLIIDDPYNAPKSDIVIDAIFGIGLSKEISGEFLDAVVWFNERQAVHVSLDIPSGLDAESGCWVGPRPGCFAEYTLTFLAGKAGLFTAEGPQACGHIHIDNLGVSIPLTNLNVVEPVDFRHALEARKLNTSKRDFGRVGIIGGGSGTIGAAIIAARSALRMGAGAVYVELVEDNGFKLDPVCPELMFRERINIEDMDAVVIGPGLGFSELARQRVSEAVDSAKVLILDADALTMVAQDSVLMERIAHRQNQTVITPHVGEAARILRCTPEDVETHRLVSCMDLAVLTGSITVLKGCGSIISLRSTRVWINPTGTPALATAGSGDALTGIIAAMFAQGFDQVTSVLGAVYLHGAASESCDCGLMATEIAPEAVRILNRWRASLGRNNAVNSAFLTAHEKRFTHKEIHA